MSHFVRLREHATKIGSGQTPSGGHRNYVANGIPLIRSQNVLMGAFFNEGLALISPSIDEEMAGSRVIPGDVLLNITGASIGRVCVVPDDVCPANVNQHVCIIRCRESLDPSYLAALLSSDRFQRLIWASQAGGTRQALTKQMVEDFEVPLLPIHLQRQIATSLKAQLAEVRAARQAAQSQSQHIASLRARMLRKVFSAIDSSPRKVLGDHALTISGATPSRDTKRYWESADVPWVKTGEVAFSPISQTEEAVSKVALAECSLTLLPPKTVLVAMYGQGKTRGQSAILEIAATTNQACFAILPNSTWISEFLHCWLMASYDDLRNLSADRGGNQANLNGALLKALKVPAPEISQQRIVVEHIKQVMSEVDALATANNASLAGLTQLPQRLLAQAFGDAA